MTSVLLVVPVRGNMVHFTKNRDWLKIVACIRRRLPFVSNGNPLKLFSYLPSLPPKFLLELILNLVVNMCFSLASTVKMWERSVGEVKIVVGNLVPKDT